MKKSELRHIIREEISNVLNEDKIISLNESEEWKQSWESVDEKLLKHYIKFVKKGDYRSLINSVLSFDNIEDNRDHLKAIAFASRTNNAFRIKFNELLSKKVKTVFDSEKIKRMNKMGFSIS